MSRKNVTYIIGNHDYLFLYFMRKLKCDLSKTNNLSEDAVTDFKGYLEDGGAVTVEQFMQLPMDERMYICDYLEDSNVYDVIEDYTKRYILVHAGISGFSAEKPLEEYFFIDFICDRIDYGKRYFPDEKTYIITGHTPTPLINADASSNVYMKHGHIAVDCGCVYGGKLAAYCIETGHVMYVNAKEKYCR